MSLDTRITLWKVASDTLTPVDDALHVNIPSGLTLKFGDTSYLRVNTGYLEVYDGDSWEPFNGSTIHTHSNKVTLDAIEAALTNTLKTNYDAAYSHISLTNNPHSVTAAQVGLGNVTNESKATMFTSPTFTGTVTIPTPFTLGAVSVTTTGTQLNYLNGANGTTGTNKVVFDTSPVLVTPTLGVATATSLAIGGATIGTNALAVNGNILTNGYIGAGGTHSAIYPIDVRLNQNANTIINVRNNDSGSSAYASYILNPYGNSWAIRSGSTSANSNALDFVVDILGTPSTKLSISTTGNATFAGSVLHPNGSASAPSISFSGDTNTGLYTSAADRLHLTVAGGTGGLFVFNGGVAMRSDWSIGFAVSAADDAGTDVRLWRDAANTLALRNGVNAQTFRVYNSYSDAGNYEMGSIGFAEQTNEFRISALAAGTGSARSMTLNVGAANIFFRTNGSYRWYISSAGKLLPYDDNVNDLGASSLRIKTGYFGTSIVNAGGSASAPSYTFDGATTKGLWLNGSNVTLTSAGGNTDIVGNGGRFLSGANIIFEYDPNFVYFSKPTRMAGNYVYLVGDATTDGSWRMSATASGNCVIEYRSGGSWTAKQTLTP